MPSCKCGLPASQRTSNTAKNPGRQFYCCPQGRGKGCDYFEWTSSGGGPGLVSAPPPPSAPSAHVDRSKVHNLSDPKYNCVWSVEALDVPGKSSVLALLQRVADHVAPVLRFRGWRVKRLMESTSKRFGGLCVGNGRDDADGASVNIQLNVRVRPDPSCMQLKPFQSLLGVMLHEITHVSIGLEDIHPPAFYALLEENKQLYFKLRGQIVSTKGGVGVDREILDSDDALDGPASIEDFKGECGARRSWSGRHTQGAEGRRIVDRALRKGEKKRPLKKGKSMIDGRSKEGKAAKLDKASMSARELAAAAAARRLGEVKPKAPIEVVEIIDLCSDDDDVGEETDDDEDLDKLMSQHDDACGCRGCAFQFEFDAALRRKGEGEIEAESGEI
mmetsp:Transcript_16451/g.32751  ORF Transcript_16451/g.32751 Transcript_16451/m.32751 type:complete len:388 (-) Transcript_16451:259-1422(-)